MVSGAAHGQALLGPMWAGLTPDSKGDPTGDTEEPDLLQKVFSYYLIYPYHHIRREKSAYVSVC